MVFFFQETVIAEKESKDFTHLSLEQKQTMFVVMEHLRNKIKQILATFERISCGADDVEPLSVEGVPRCLLQPKQKDSEMAQILADLKKQEDQLQEVLVQKKTEMQLKLHELASKMDHAVVLFPQE